MAGEAARLTGTTVGGYRIEELIGRGGMGEVYRGRHDRLDKPVAVKTLPKRLTRDRVARARFLRESKIASRIDHPYVATVFDLIDHDDEPLLVMELIEGRTLRECLRDERLSAEQVRRYGSEIADALAAIHRAGLVHRDLKPSNVMITPDDHVKVMDFGVAQPAAGTVAPDAPTSTETLTEIERAGGTPMYMSPEQLRGRAVDARSDLFSLGIVLYEAITGGHPFARGSLVDTMSAIIHEPPGRGTEPDTLTASGPLRHVVTRLLEKEPKRRYQSAEILLEHLKAASSAPDAALRAGAAEPGKRTAAWTWGVPAAALVMLIVALAWAFSSGRIAAVDPRQVSAADGATLVLPPVGTPRPVIAVLPFVDETGEEVRGSRGEMLAAFLATDLSGSDFVRPLDDERVTELVGDGAARTQAERLHRVRTLGGADFVVTGRIFRDASTYFATVDLFGESGESPIRSFRAPAGTATGLAVAILPPLAAALAPASDPPERESIRISTSDEQALIAFVEAARLARELRYAAAIERLKSAVERDPRFIEAHVRLVRMLAESGDVRAAREWMARTERVVDSAGIDDDDDLRIEISVLAAMLEFDLPKSLQARLELVDRRPDDPGPLRDLAHALTAVGRHEEAVVAAQRAVERDGLDPRNHLALARALEYLGNLDSSARSVDAAEELYRQLGWSDGHPAVAIRRGGIAWDLGRFADAVDAYRRAEELYDAAGLEIRAAEMRANTADALAALGEHSAALELYEETLAPIRRAGLLERLIDSYDHMGVTLKRMGRDPEGESWIRRAVDEASRIDNDAVLLTPKLNLGMHQCETGRLAEGTSLLQDVKRIATTIDKPWYGIEASTYLADLAYRQGRLDESIARYEDLDTEATALLRRNADGEITDPNLSALVGLLGGRLTVLHVAARFEDALRVADRTVTLSESLDESFLLEQALVKRARLVVTLADYGRAEDDLDRAESLAGGRPGEEGRVAAEAGLTRALAAIQRDDWEGAAAALDRVPPRTADSLWPDIALPIATLRGQTAAGLGDLPRAVELMRAAAEVARAGVYERAYARVALAEVLAASPDPGHPEEAVREARAAIDEGRRLAQPLVTARAAAVIASSPLPLDPGDTRDAAAEGTAALDEFLARVPPEYREGVANREDLRDIRRRLGGGSRTAGNDQRISAKGDS